mmetsp:Transcript_26160/g.43273  ORF Transcript_26160/g.43273 Transcript_26160/m.43273 type:complete len:493 (+) Transcript_26160:184-1662(+)|eukprot:CAMPEP_0119341348 /NCGR_PEP_ID=MMETSP1333-20130426/102144_1 /TAXON_ID=418940 /ORGANISM="Scyphosphaera apsteinii, Strain RCC1455" /LENGTH=492 /DNA_ID=CAMNT_0007353289 /DNA_START=161 /DNA_END=1639 /DNA_ORIENTATION=+
MSLGIGWQEFSHRFSLVGYIGLWYVISISLILWNKWLFTVFGLPFPLLITSLHLALKIPVARFVIYKKRLPLTVFDSWKSLFHRVVPNGLTTAGDIGFSNASLLYISVTYYTIIKSSVPLWIMCFSVWLGLQRARAAMFFVLACIVSGIALASFDQNWDAVEDADFSDELNKHTSEPAGNSTFPLLADAQAAHRRLLQRLLRSSDSSNDDVPFKGAVIVLCACACAGFRWACTQLLLMSTGDEARLHSRHDSACSTNQNSLAATPSSNDSLRFCECDGTASDMSGESAAPTAASATAPMKHDAMHPVMLIYLVTPWGLLALLPISITLESADVGSYFADIPRKADLVIILLAAIIGALTSFGLLLTEYHVVRLSSGLTLSVAGVLKEVLTVISSSIFLGDKLTVYNIGGLSLCMFGIVQYNRIKLAEGSDEVSIQVQQIDGCASQGDGDGDEMTVIGVTDDMSIVESEIDISPSVIQQERLRLKGERGHPSP